MYIYFSQNFPHFKYDECILCGQKFEKYDDVFVLSIKKYHLDEDLNTDERHYTKNKPPLHEDCLYAAIGSLRASVLIEKERLKLENATKEESD